MNVPQLQISFATNSEVTVLPEDTGEEAIRKLERSVVLISLYCKEECVKA